MNGECPVRRVIGQFAGVQLHEWRVADYSQKTTFYCVWCRKIVVEDIR